MTSRADLRPVVLHEREHERADVVARSHVDPAEARQWVDDYYRIFKEECVPIGHAVNPNICMAG